MIPALIDLIKTLGPLASVVNFLLILGLFLMACKVRTNDLVHFEKSLKETKADLGEWREKLGEDISYVRDRLDWLIDRLMKTSPD